MLAVGVVGTMCGRPFFYRQGARQDVVGVLVVGALAVVLVVGVLAVGVLVVGVLAVGVLVVGVLAGRDLGRGLGRMR